MAGISIQNLRKSYGRFDVLHDLNLEITDGEFVSLVGPSGCGKSTLLRSIAGLESISGGQIRIDGRLVNHVAPKDRDIAMVFQSYALYPHMSVRDNMSLSLRLRRRSRGEIAQRVDNAAAILGLEKLLDRSPRELSGGQRQRVAMGRALVRDPKAFLFDEPLSNLDAKLRVQMRAEIKALHQRLKSTMIYVTHDQVEAMTMADRIVAMRDGRIEQVGAPLDLYDRPETLFVATFIGAPSMNLIEGRTEVAPDGATGFVSTDGIIRVPVPHAAVQGELTLGIRPEHITLVDRGLPAEVSLIEPLGPETQLTLRAGQWTLCCVVKDRVPFQPGASVNIAFAPAKQHFFDTKSGFRLG